jgi:predicted dehydrogenase
MAKRKKKTLMVDHTFLYTGAVKKMKETVEGGAIGKIQYFDSTRINLGLFQHDVNVIWDLAPHDISILLCLVKDSPCGVIATGVSHTRNNIENIAYITLHYRHNMIAHFTC